MKPLRLKYSRTARRHLRGIARYTEETWGEAQRDAYVDSLFAGCEAIRKAPLEGRDRDDLKPGMRSLRIEKHVVYYIPGSGMVWIAAILHERMDPARHL